LGERWAFTLADGDVIPWHYHSESTDHYFVLANDSARKPTTGIAGCCARVASGQVAPYRRA
jgi:hypothetical protein